MTITTPRSRSRSTSAVTIVALLAAFGMFAATRARAAPLNDVEGIDFNLKLPVADEGNMRFDPATVDLQDGNRVAISADVTVTGSDGKQTTSGIIAILIGAVTSPSAGFMDYTDDGCLADGVEASERGVSDGTSNTIVFAARACAAIRRAWNAYLTDRRMHRN